MWETQVQPLDWEDPLEKEMAPHSSILAWRISWTEEPGGLQSLGLQRNRHNSATNTDWLTQQLRLQVWLLNTPYSNFILKDALFSKVGIAVCCSILLDCRLWPMEHRCKSIVGY